MQKLRNDSGEAPSPSFDWYSTAGNAFLIMYQIIQILAEWRKVDKKHMGNWAA